MSTLKKIIRLLEWADKENFEFTQSDARDALGLFPSDASKLVAKLVKSAMVETRGTRFNHRTHGRHTLYGITDAGRAWIRVTNQTSLGRTTR